MTPQPIPSWIAPRRSSVALPAVNPSMRPLPVIGEDDMAGPLDPHAIAQGEELPPGSARPIHISILPETDSPEMDALRMQNMQLETALAEAIAENARMRKDILVASEKELVKLAVAISEQIVGRELDLDPKLYVTWASRAIELLSTEDEVTIAVSPEVESLITPEKWLQFFPDAKIVVDASLKPGHTQVRSGATRVGAGKADRLAAVLEALGEIAK
ncbi:MAG: FliH/SctL family protein [Polyangiaceae bacterium]